MSILGAKIREAREKRNLSVEDLASLTGLSKNFIYRVERGDQDMSSTNLLIVAKVLKVSTDYLLTGEEPKSPAYYEIEEFWKKHTENIIKETKGVYTLHPSTGKFLRFFEQLPPETQERIYKVLEVIATEIKGR